MKLDFLLTPDTALAGWMPLEALKAGDREPVRRLFRGLQATPSLDLVAIPRQEKLRSGLCLLS